MTDTWTWATVTQATPLRIKVDGDTSALDATTDNLVGSLAVGDRVRVHLHSDGIIVTGLQGGGTPEATAATPDTLALRDGDGQIKAADGVAADDVFNKGQVDAALVGTWQSIWMAVRTTTLSITSNSTTLVTWPTAYYDPLSLTVNASGYIEVPTDGYYRAFFHMSWTNNSSGTYRIAYWEQGRAENDDWGLVIAPIGEMRAPFVVGAVYLTAGTEVSITVRQDSGSTLQLGVRGLPRLVLDRMIT